jgi:hypothetical protein
MATKIKKMISEQIVTKIESKPLTDEDSNKAAERDSLYPLAKHQLRLKCSYPDYTVGSSSWF